MSSEKTPRKIQLVFFRTDAAREPVRDWLKALDQAERRSIGTDLLRAQWRWPVGAQAPEGAGTVSKKNMGSSIDDFLRKENIFEEAQAQAVKEVVAWQLAKAMRKKRISKARMAVLLKTSRSQVDRILDPKCDITLSSLQRAAALVGQRVVIELV